MKNIKVKLDQNGDIPHTKLNHIPNVEVELLLKTEPQQTNIPSKNIKLIVYDFDGVMTDNKVYIDQMGHESVRTNRADGMALGLLSAMGFKQIILSSEENPVVSKRAEKLKIDCIHGTKDKLKTLKKYLTDNNIDKNKVVFVGNDLNDKAVMQYIGMPAAPKDAADEILEIAQFIIPKKGGDGVVRELYHIIKKTRNA